MKTVSSSPMPTRAIATSTLWQIASQAAMAALSVVSVKFVAIGLSQELAGAYNSAYGYLQLFAILADFGLYAVSVREVSAAQNKERVLGGLLVLRTVITCASLGAAVFIAWLVPAWRGTPLPVGIAIASLVPFFTLLAGVLRTVFQIHYVMHYVFVAEVLQRVLTAGLMGLIILSGVRLSGSLAVYQAFLWVGSAGAILLFVLSLVFAIRLMRIRPVFDPSLLKRLLTHAAPYGVAFLCIALYRQFDLTMIAILRDDFAIQNALYGFAGRIAEMTYLVPTFLLNSVLPILGERTAKGERTERLLGKTLLIVLLFGSASSLFSFFWARPIMALLTSDAYLSTAASPGADTALSLLSIPMFFNGIVLFSFYVLLARHAWRPLVFAMLTAVVLSITLNILWIPDAGFMGAIRTASIVHVFLALILFPLACHVSPLAIPPMHLLRWMVFSVLLGVPLFLTSGLLSTLPLVLLGLVFGTLGTGALLIATGLYTALRQAEPVMV